MVDELVKRSIPGWRLTVMDNGIRSGVLDAIARSQAAFLRTGRSRVAEAAELAALPGAGRLADEHESYIVAVTRRLLDRAVEESQIQPVDTAALAHVLGGLGRELSRPEVIPLIGTSPKQAADQIVEIVLRGLERA